MRRTHNGLRLESRRLLGDESLLVKSLIDESKQEGLGCPGMLAYSTCAYGDCVLSAIIISNSYRRRNLLMYLFLLVFSSARNKSGACLAHVMQPFPPMAVTSPWLWPNVKVVHVYCRETGKVGHMQWLHFKCFRRKLKEFRHEEYYEDFVGFEPCR